MTSSDLARGGERRWFGRGRTRALLSAGILVGSGAVGTSAYWNTGTSVEGVSVQAGAIHIDLADNSRVKPETYLWADLGGTLSTTGESRAKIMRVRNNSAGRLTFGYSISAAATNPAALGGALRLTVRKGGAVGASPGGPVCTGGVVVGSAGAPANGFAAAVGNLSSTQVTPYDDLCVQVALPSGSGVSGGATTDITFTFTATQVVS